MSRMSRRRSGNWRVIATATATAKGLRWTVTNAGENLTCTYISFRQIRWPREQVQPCATTHTQRVSRLQGVLLLWSFFGSTRGYEKRTYSHPALLTCSCRGARVTLGHMQGEGGEEEGGSNDEGPDSRSLHRSCINTLTRTCALQKTKQKKHTHTHTLTHTHKHTHTCPRNRVRMLVGVGPEKMDTLEVSLSRASRAEWLVFICGVLAVADSRCAAQVGWLLDEVESQHVKVGRESGCGGRGPTFFSYRLADHEAEAG